LTTLDARRMPPPRLPDPNETWTPETARQILESCAASGEPLAVCARRLGVTPARLYWWKARFAKAKTPPTLASLSLVPATVVSADAASPITIRLPNGIAIELSAESGSASLVAAIVAELSKAPS
jgi:transposase-like protein